MSRFLLSSVVSDVASNILIRCLEAQPIVVQSHPFGESSADRKRRLKRERDRRYRQRKHALKQLV